jgi:antitoxin component HigA of HigAB toxin-antitoxin module
MMTLIEAYEEEHHSIPDASPVEVLRALMDANNPPERPGLRLWV